jgi:GntR family transcriptional repressor for pyruvate dehydrogenase complex
MTFEIHAVDRRKLYAAIVDQIVEGVRAGAFPAGQALPSERELASRLSVGRSSLREAIRVLEHAGVLEVRTGIGTYVTEKGLSKASMLRVEAAVVGEQSPLDVIAARRALEPGCAELAAIHRRPADIEVLRANIREHATLEARGKSAEDVDMGFHLAVAAASNNPMLVTLVEQVVETMRQGTWRDLKGRTRSRDGSAERYLEQHRAVLVAIERCDAAGAAKAMREHLDLIERGLLAELS